MRRITYTNWMSKIFKEITNGRGERVLENPAVQVHWSYFQKDESRSEYHRSCVRTSAE